MKKKKKWLISVISLVAILLIVFLSIPRPAAEEYSTVLSFRGDLKQTVSETGTIKPVKGLALSFLTSGKIQEIKVAVGDKVVAGQLLGSLDSASLETRKIEAEAALSVAEASLSKLIAGASNAEINVSLTSLNQARSALNSARADLEQIKKTVAENIKQAEQTLRDLEDSSLETITPTEQAVALAQTAYNNTVKNSQTNTTNALNSALLTITEKVTVARISLDNIQTLLDDEDARYVLGAKNSVLLTQVKDGRQILLRKLSEAESDLALAQQGLNYVDILKAGETAKGLLSELNRVLDTSYALLEASITSASFTQLKLDNYKTLISSQVAQGSGSATALEGAIQGLQNALLAQETNLRNAQDNLTQAQVNLSNAQLSARNALSSTRLAGEQQIISAQARVDNASSSFLVAEAQYNNTVAPARTQDLAVAEAQVRQAEANLEGIKQQIKDSILLAPVAGVINQVNYEVGEQFGLSGQPLVSLLMDDSFNIEVDISESNISKIKEGNAVEITIDAFPNDLVLPGLVSFIEPAQTLIQDVVYYKVKIEFLDLDNLRLDLLEQGLSLKSGMTANIIILTNQVEQVIQIPARAVIEEDGQKLVRVLRQKKLVSLPVSLGLAGDEGQVEVKEGLAEGETVVTFIRTNKK